MNKIKVFSKYVFCILLLASPVLSQGPASLPSYDSDLNVMTAGAPGHPQLSTFLSGSALPLAPRQYLPAHSRHSEHHNSVPAPIGSAWFPHSGHQHPVPAPLESACSCHSQHPHPVSAPLESAQINHPGHYHTVPAPLESACSCHSEHEARLVSTMSLPVALQSPVFPAMLTTVPVVPPTAVPTALLPQPVSAMPSPTPVATQSALFPVVLTTVPVVPPPALPTAAVPQSVSAMPSPPPVALQSAMLPGSITPLPVVPPPAVPTAVVSQSVSAMPSPSPAALQSAGLPASLTTPPIVSPPAAPTTLSSQSVPTMPSPVAPQPAELPAMLTSLLEVPSPAIPAEVPNGPSDTDLLAFFFNILCLQAQLYSCAAIGSPLNSTMTGNGPAPTSCRKANLNTTLAAVVNEFAREEAAHLALISNTLMVMNVTPVCPLVNIDTVFGDMAMKAFSSAGLPLNYTFNAYLDDVSFLFVSSLLEDLAASTLLGGQAMMTSPDFRLVAGQMGSAKSYHAGILRAMTATSPLVQQNDVFFSTTVATSLNALAGSPQLIFGLTNAQGVSLANVNGKGLTPVATLKQILDILTLGASTGNGGGFFPNNLNGNIRN